MTAERAIDLAMACTRALFSLTTAEARVLRAFLEGGTHESVARLRGVEASTLKKQAQAICRKTGAANMQRASIGVLLDAIAILEAS